MRMSSSLYQIDKLDSDNYDGWKVQMKNVLVHSELWSYVDGSVPKPEAVADLPAWKCKDEKALATIVLSIKTSQLIHIKRCETSREAWKKLEEIHQPSGPARKVTLFKRLLQTKMAESQSMLSHLNDFFNVVEKLAEIGIELEKEQEELLIIILLSSLPKSYENFVIAIESRDKLPSINALKTKLIEEGQRKEGGNTQENSNHDQAFLSKEESKSRENNYRKIKGKCFSCGRRGHIAKYCSENKKEEKRKGRQNPLLLFSAMNPSLRKSSWIVDSGSTSHMCWDRNMFSTLSLKKERIELAANKYIDSSGIGEINIKTKGKEIKLREVLFVPDLTTNFLSVAKAVDNGCVVVFSERKVFIKKNGKTVLSAERIGNLFVFDGNTTRHSSNFLACSDEKSDIMKWHERLGHLNFKSIAMLQKCKMVHGLNVPETNETINCEICAKGKICTKPFQKYSTLRSNSVLELVHTDICGPMRSTSNGGAKYFAVFVDDFSRKMFVYFLRNKSDIFDVFKAFKAEVEKQTGRKIKCLRSDNGREYLSSEFTEFLVANGIRRQLTVPYTPQMNGVAERANRTLVEMARCMLISSRLPETFWAEAVNTAVYLRNRCPTKVLDGKTPQEAWTGIKPSVSHLKIFGSKAIMLDKRPGKPKFGKRGIECVMVGYCEETRAYRLYEMSSRKIHKSKDVVFIETSGNFSVDSNPTDYVIVDLEKSAQEEPKVNTELKSRAESEDDEFFHGAMGSFDAENEAIEQQFDRDLVEENENMLPSARSESDEAIEEEKADLRFGRSRIISRGKPSKSRKVPSSLHVMKAIVEDQNPLTVEEVLSRKDADLWLDSMKEEYNSLLERETWEKVDLPKGRKAIKCKWVFNIKRDKSGCIERYKARLVAKGCSQKFGFDYTETFSPVVRYSTIRILLAFAVEHELLVHQMDVTAAYLNGELKEQVFMEQPEMFVDQEHPEKVLKLKKALYGLKQSGREWNRKLDITLRNIGFTRCKIDPCVYTMNKDNEYNIIAVYVDDIIIACSTRKTLDEVKHKISLDFDVVDRGPIEYYLGIEVERDGEKGEIAISQKQLIENLLISNQMADCRRRSTPLEAGIKLKKCANCTTCEKVDVKVYQSLMGSLLYIGLSTRPDIMHSVSKLAQFNANPHREHLDAAKHVLRYLSGTVNAKLFYRKTGEALKAYADADWAGSIDDRKSYTGYTFMLAGGSVSWESKKQPTVALSSTEAEYMAISAASKEAVYLTNLIKDIGFGHAVEEPIQLYGDNLSAQQLVQNPVFHARSKHIDIRIHFVREVFEKNLISLNYVPTDEMLADILTKNLCKLKHFKFSRMLGLQF